MLNKKICNLCDKLVECTLKSRHNKVLFNAIICVLHTFV